MAQTKKLLRIHTAGPNDTNVDNTKLAVEFQDRANAAQSTVEIKVFPASQLGQTREVIEAMRLGSGAAGTTGGPAEYASFVRRLGVLGLPFEWKSYEHALRVLDGPVGKELTSDMEKGGFKVLGLGHQLGLPQRHHLEEGSEDRGRPEGPEDPHHPDQGVRRRDQLDGRQRHADELRRDLHLAAERRARRLRAHRRRPPSRSRCTRWRAAWRSPST